jgi:hypothetical protein
MEAFFTSFWPNLAATIFGVIIGLPVALWLHRKGHAAIERDRLQGERTRLLRSLEIIDESIAANRPRLERLKAALGAGRVLFDPGLETAAWEAVGSGVCSGLHETALPARLAYHFARLTIVSRLNGLYLNYVVSVGAPPVTAESARDVLKQDLLEAVEDLLKDSDAVVASIGETAGRLRGELAQAPGHDDRR